MCLLGNLCVSSLNQLKGRCFCVPYGKFKIYLVYMHIYTHIYKFNCLGFLWYILHLESYDGYQHFLDDIYLAYIRNIMNTEPATY